MSQASPPQRRLHPAWIVAAVTLGALVSSAAFRSSTGVLMEPIEQEFGWSRATTSGAVSLNLVLFGLVAPFAAALMESWGVRRVVTIALVIVAASTALTTVMTSPWQLWLLWGVCVGIGTGAMALVLGAIVANRWFVAHRGLITGVFSAGNATGQLIFLPAIAAAASGPGWRWAAGIVALLASVMGLLVWLFLRDRPSDVGVWPLGATEPPATEVHHRRNAAVHALDVLRTSSTKWPFWALMLTFFVCGWTTNGLVQTHFVPAAHDHGMPATTAAGLLAVVGIFDMVGTIASGWLTDRIDPRYLLIAYYGLRGASLLFVHDILGASPNPPTWAFVMFYGLDWVATVPPTVALCRSFFGLERSGVVFGWTYASHMVGASAGASVAGLIRAQSGSYHLAWTLAAGLCFGAAALCVLIPRTRGRVHSDESVRTK